MRDATSNKRSKRRRFCNGYVHDVVAPNESVTVLVFQIAVFVLFCLFEGDIHIAVKTCEDATVFGCIIELDNDRAAEYGFEKVGRGAAVTL